MPVYNSGDYLHTAVGSILSQNLKEMELILVDDGSTDGSTERCDEYARKDSRVVVIHQKNGGICNARNNAMAVARGEYIGFSDHDDEFVGEAFAEAYAYGKKNDLDMVKFGHKSIKIHGTTILKAWNFQYEDEVIEPEDMGKRYLELLRDEKMECVWDSLYRREFIEKNHLQLNTFFKSGGEDIDFNGEVVRCHPRFGTMKEIYYYHYIRVGFSTSSKFDEFKIAVATTFAERLNHYLSTYDAEAIYKQDLELYAYTIVRRMVGSLLYSTSMPACTYSKEKIYALLDGIYNDKNVNPCFFKMSKLSFFLYNKKYGLLYTAFTWKLYGICNYLYTQRNNRDKIVRLSGRVMSRKQKWRTFKI